MGDSANIKIIQWNIRSLLANNHNLKVLLNNYKPHIASLNETWLSSHINLSFSGYDFIRQDRLDGRGGIAFLIKNNLNHINVKLDVTFLPENFQVLVVKILNPFIHVVNIYIPPRVSVNQHVWTRLMNSIPDPKIVVGDLNAHHPLWGGSVVNEVGKTIYSTLEPMDLIVLNDGSPTRLLVPGQNPSSVDLTLVFSPLASRCSWEVIEDCGNSDHFPTLTSFQLLHSLVWDVTHTPKRLFKKANWDSYYNSCSELFRNNMVDSFEDFRDILDSAANESIPWSKPPPTNSNRKYAPWWDESCDEIIRIRRKALRDFKLHPTIPNLIKAKQMIAKAHQIFKIKKKE